MDALDELGPTVADEQCAERFDEVLQALATAPDPAYGTMLDVVAVMLADRTLVRVGDVEARCGLGERTLHRLFARYVGASPVDVPGTRLEQWFKRGPSAPFLVTPRWHDARWSSEGGASPWWLS